MNKVPVGWGHNNTQRLNKRKKEKKLKIFFEVGMSTFFITLLPLVY
jgi:hypothetical protein